MSEQVNEFAGPTEWVFIGDSRVPEGHYVITCVLFPRKQLLKDLLLTRKQLVN
jgi:hypothetical protein